MAKSAGSRQWRPLTRTGVLLIAAGSLFGLSACSGSNDAAPPARTAPPVTTATTETTETSAPAAADLAAEAQPAVALVNSYTPGGYPGSAVSSGYDWATSAGQMIVDASLSGEHLFQIACSGTGRIAVHLPADSAARTVTCGANPVGFPFTGKLDVAFDGAPANKGTYAWRVLAKA